MKIQQTTAAKKIDAMTRRIRVLQGGQGASKTFTVLLKLIDQCIARPGTSATVFQLELTKMKRTVIRDFMAIMRATGNWKKAEWNGSASTYTFRNGSYMEFMGLKESDIGKGFRRDMVYFNEANRGIDFEAYQQIASRAKLIFIDFNPDREFWVHKEVLPYDDAEYLQLTFEDNEAIDPQERANIIGYKTKGFIEPNRAEYDVKENIRSAYWANKWRVYGLGETGVLEGQIYQWRVMDGIPHEAELLSYGLDFGYNDPTVLVELYKYNEGYIINQRLWKSRLDSDMLKQEVLGLKLQRGIPIKADGARPELIATLKKAGLAVEAVDKRNKNDRILLLASETIWVTRTSVELIREKDNYVWKKSGENGYEDVPVEYDDHGMDATLYAADKVIIRFKPKRHWGRSRMA